MTIATWDPEPDAPVGLGVWAAELRAAAELATSFALTAFVPDTLKVRQGRAPDSPVDEAATVATVTAALLTGREVGLSPMASLRSIDVIHGTPAMRAHTMRALVLARGHDMWVVESTTTRCIQRGQRKGSTHVQEVEWTIDDARRLRIADRPQWRAQPREMLRVRATAALARLIAPEALLGLPYVVEELGDDLDGLDALDADTTPPPADEVKAPPRKRTARRAAVRPVVEAQLPPDPATPTPPPALPPDPAAAGPNEAQGDEPADVPMVTPAQLKALHAALRDAGIHDRDDGLALYSGVTGRNVASSKDLTRDECSHVLDALAELRLAADPWGNPDDVADPVDVTDPGDEWPPVDGSAP